MDLSIFEHVTAKVSADFVDDVIKPTASSAAQEIFFNRIAHVAGVTCSVDDKQIHWSIEGSWAGIFNSYRLLETVYRISDDNRDATGRRNTVKCQSMVDIPDLNDTARKVFSSCALGEHTAVEPVKSLSVNDEQCDDGFQDVDHYVHLREEHTDSSPGNNSQWVNDSLISSVSLDVKSESSKQSAFPEVANSTESQGKSSLFPPKNSKHDPIRNAYKSVSSQNSPTVSKIKIKLEKSKPLAKQFRSDSSAEISGDKGPALRTKKYRKSPHVCKSCWKPFASLSGVNRHVRTAHQGTRFCCNECKKLFTSKESLDRHMKVVHKGLRCSTCSKIVNSREELVEHESSDCPGNKNLNKVRCSHCTKRYSCASNLNKHFRIAHQGIRFECEFCEKSYIQREGLTEHQWSVHSFCRCRHCHKSFDTAEEYIEHINNTHPTQRLTADLTRQDRKKKVVGEKILRCMKRTRQPATCDQCAKVFSSQSNLGKHVRLVHEGQRFRCPSCDKSFACKEQLKRHDIVAHEGNEFSCSLCSATFVNRAGLAKHQQSKHKQLVMDETYQCEHCGKTFLYECNLMRHRKVDHEGFRFTCSKCGKDFKSNQWLREHDLVDHQGARYPCQQCTKVFRNKTKLKEHVMSLHTGLQPYRCDDCDMKFSRRSSLAYHTKKCHTNPSSLKHSLETQPPADKKVIKKEQLPGDPSKDKSTGRSTTAGYNRTHTTKSSTMPQDQILPHAVSLEQQGADSVPGWILVTNNQPVSQRIAEPAKNPNVYPNLNQVMATDNGTENTVYIQSYSESIETPHTVLDIPDSSRQSSNTENISIHLQQAVSIIPPTPPSNRPLYYSNGILQPDHEPTVSGSPVCMSSGSGETSHDSYNT